MKEIGALKEAGELPPVPVNITLPAFKPYIILIKINSKTFFKGGSAPVNSVWKNVPKGSHYK